MSQPKVLLDSNILIHILHRNESVRKNLERIGWENCCISDFCKQKARLRRLGQQIEDGDLYIGCTALALNIPIATENVKHLGRIEGLRVENWVKR